MLLITATRSAKYLVMTARKATARRRILACVVVPKVKRHVILSFRRKSLHVFASQNTNLSGLYENFNKV